MATAFWSCTTNFFQCLRTHIFIVYDFCWTYFEICADQWKWGPLFCMKSRLREESFACFCSSTSVVLEGKVSFRSHNLHSRATAPLSNLSTMNPKPSLKRSGPAFLCLQWTTLGSRSPLSLHCGYCWPLLPRLVRSDGSLCWGFCLCIKKWLLCIRPSQKSIHLFHLFFRFPHLP